MDKSNRMDRARALARRLRGFVLSFPRGSLATWRRCTSTTRRSSPPPVRGLKRLRPKWNGGRSWKRLRAVWPSLRCTSDGSRNLILRTGKLSCFVQITIFGIGFRYWYEKEASVYNVFPQIEDE